MAWVVGFPRWAKMAQINTMVVGVEAAAGDAAAGGRGAVQDGRVDEGRRGVGRSR
jgi:hypothetical protein